MTATRWPLRPPDRAETHNGNVEINVEINVYINDVGGHYARPTGW